MYFINPLEQQLSDKNMLSVVAFYYLCLEYLDLSAMFKPTTRDIDHT